MGKYNEFVQPLKPKGQYPKIMGNYGCQSCNEQIDHAWFNEREGRLFWFCSQGHESEIKVGV